MKTSKNYFLIYNKHLIFYKKPFNILKIQVLLPDIVYINTQNKTHCKTNAYYTSVKLALSICDRNIKNTTNISQCQFFNLLCENTYFVKKNFMLGFPNSEKPLLHFILFKAVPHYITKPKSCVVSHMNQMQTHIFHFHGKIRK